MVDRKFITCYVDNKPYVSLESAVRQVFEIIRGDNWFKPETLKDCMERSEMRVRKNQVLLMAFEDYLPCQTKFFVDGKFVQLFKIESIGTDYCFLSFNPNIDSAILNDAREMFNHFVDKLFHDRDRIISLLIVEENKKQIGWTCSTCS